MKTLISILLFISTIAFGIEKKTPTGGTVKDTPGQSQNASQDYVLGTANTATTNGDGSTFVASTSSISLGTGVWELIYWDSATRSAAGSGNGYFFAEILNATDSTSIGYAESQYSGTGSDVEYAYASEFHISNIVKITGAKTFYGRIKTRLNSGTGTTFYVRGWGKFYAKKIN